MLNDLRYIVAELGADNQKFSGETIVLYGSQGFLGLLLQKYFDFLNKEVLTIPCRVFNYDIFLPNNTSPPNYYKCDIVNDALPYFTEPHSVFHLASRASPQNYSKNQIATFNAGIRGTQNLLEHCIKYPVKSFLNFSSSEIYGNPTVVPTPETYLGAVGTMNDRACYDQSKSGSETLCYMYNKEHNINTKIVRLFNVYGYINRGDGRVIPNFTSQILKNEKIKIYSPGKQTRTFCWFTDALIGIIKVLLNGTNQPYNIGRDSEEITMLGLARKIEKIAEKSDMIDIVPAPKVYGNEPERRCPDLTKARNELGYLPKITLDEGLEKFYKWAKDNYV